MSLDMHSYTAPARVRTLLVPIGDVSQEQFSKYVDLVRSAFEVRLVDVTPTKRKLFNPQGFPSGRVIYDIGTSINDQETLFLHDFEPFRKTFVVIGLSNDPNTSQEHIEKLSKIYKSSIVHSIIVFDTETPPASNSPSIFHHTTRNIETIMCDITNNLLESLSDYYTSYQHLTLRSPVSIGENDRLKAISKQKKRISSGSAISLSLTDPSQTKISLTTSNERRQSRIKGRQQKIMGNAYLLAGRYTDALNEFNEALILLKASNDHLWLASALEGIAVTLIMLDFVKVSYQLPASVSQMFTKRTLNSASPATPVNSPRPSLSSAVGVELSNASTDEVIYHLSLRIIHYYETSKNDPEDSVPNLVYYESILRLMKLMTSLNVGGGYNAKVLDNVVKNTLLTSNNATTSPALYDPLETLKLANKIRVVELKKMDILSQTRIYSSLSTIFGDLGFQRKRGLVLRSLFISLIQELSSTDASYTNSHLTSLLNSLLSIYGVDNSPESHLKESYSSKWAQLHKSIVRLCIDICEKTKDHQSVVSLKSLLLTRYFHSLTDNDQIKLLNEIRYTSKNYDVTTTYFDPFLVRGFELSKDPNTPIKEERSVSSSLKKDPFIYNPYLKKETPTQSNILVQGEFIGVNLTLQNPFAFALEINDIQIEGLEIFKNQHVIQPKTISTVNLLAKPLEHGSISLKELKISVFDSSLQKFQITGSKNVQQFQTQKHTKPDDSQRQVITHYNDNISNNNISDRVETVSLPLEIIPCQPNIQASAPINPIMLLEGGKQKIQIKLKNNSDVLANYVSFSSVDSTTEPLKRALENKDLPANEVHELEYFLLKNPLNILTDVKEINPLEEVTIDAEVKGKRGLNKINLILEYGHKIDDNTYIRRLDLAIPVAVNNCIDLASCDVIPLTQSIKGEQSIKAFEFIKSSGFDTSSFVLFFLDLRNVLTKPVNINLNLFDYHVDETIAPLETKRLIIPLKRFTQPELKPIPSLSNKQYILPKISKAEDDFQREAFWVREKLLDNVSGTWTVGESQGDIEFRGIRISQKMLNVLKVESIDITAELNEIDSKDARLYYPIKTGQLFSVKVKVHNNSDSTVKGILRNVPMSLSYGSVDRRILFNGSLQETTVRKLKAGETYETNIGLVILERGDYEWGAIFDEVDSDKQHVTRRPLRIKGI